MQITRVTSEALQATIRRLLPSQQGFGEDLQASNVITPIIDLTPTAEGSLLGTNLQTAQAFGSQTAFDISNATTTIVNTAGFHRITGAMVLNHASGASQKQLRINITDGVGSKQLYEITTESSTGGYSNLLPLDFVVFLTSGDSVTGFSSAVSGHITGSVRQIADVNGNLVNPAGFTSE